MCVEMFLAGAQRMSQTDLGLLGHYVCRQILGRRDRRRG